MEEFNMERCAFDEDSLFAFVVFRDQSFANMVKAKNKATDPLSVDKIKALPGFSEAAHIWYYFSPVLGVFSLANSEFRGRH